MKKIILASLLCLFVAIPVSAEDDRVLFDEAAFSVDMPDGWEWELDEKTSRYIFSHTSFGGDCGVFISTPNPASEMDFGEYVGAQLGLNFIAYSGLGLGKGRLVESVEQNFDGYPSIFIRWVFEKDNQLTLAGVMVGVDFDGWYVTMVPLAAPEYFDAFIQQALPLVNSFIFEEEWAEENEDALHEKGAEIGAVLRAMIEMGKNK